LGGFLLTFFLPLPVSGTLHMRTGEAAACCRVEKASGIRWGKVMTHWRCRGEGGRGSRPVCVARLPPRHLAAWRHAHAPTFSRFFRASRRTGTVRACLPARSIDGSLYRHRSVSTPLGARCVCGRILVLASATSRSSSCSGTWVDGRRSTYVRACRVVERTERLNTRWTDMPARRAFTPQGKHGSAVGVIPGARQTWLGRCDQGDQRSAVSEASASLPETAVEGWGKAWPSASRP
jgi:hypothetical protein